MEPSPNYLKPLECLWFHHPGKKVPYRERPLTFAGFGLSLMNAPQTKNAPAKAGAFVANQAWEGP
jgi:hypothetical protein